MAFDMACTSHVPGLSVALWEPWGSLGMALVEPEGGLGVAFGSQSVGYQMALGWLYGGFGWPCPAFRGSKFEVGGPKFGVHHQHSEYNSPIPPPSGWSGGTLVSPWTYPIPVAHPQSPLFNQASLSKTRKSIAEPAEKRRKRRKRDGDLAFSCASCDF
jgi:hypothetical protein